MKDSTPCAECANKNEGPDSPNFCKAFRYRRMDVVVEGSPPVLECLRFERKDGPEELTK